MLVQVLGQEVGHRCTRSMMGAAVNQRLVDHPKLEAIEGLQNNSEDRMGISRHQRHLLNSNSSNSSNDSVVSVATMDPPATWRALPGMGPSSHRLQTQQLAVVASGVEEEVQRLGR